MTEPPTSSEPNHSSVHLARAGEFLVAQAVGVSAAIGAVWLGRRHTPHMMKQAENFLVKTFYPPASAEEARRLANMVVMMSAGYVTSVGSQVGLSQWRERSDGQHPSWLADWGRVSAGWVVGGIGATTSWTLAQRYGRSGSAHQLYPFMDQLEARLDKVIFNGATLIENNRAAEAMAENLAMIIGSCPASIGAQAAYDKLTRESPAKSLT